MRLKYMIPQHDGFCCVCQECDRVIGGYKAEGRHYVKRTPRYADLDNVGHYYCVRCGIRKVRTHAGTSKHNQAAE